MDYSKLKVKKKFINVNVGKYTLTNDMPLNVKKYIYMTISKDFFEVEKSKKQINVNLSDSVTSDEKSKIEEIKNDDISKKEHE